MSIDTPSSESPAEQPRRRRMSLAEQLALPGVQMLQGRLQRLFSPEYRSAKRQIATARFYDQKEHTTDEA